jgi:hypothetical protein
MGFDEVPRKRILYVKSQKQNASLTIRPGALSTDPTICFHVAASNQNGFNKQLEEVTSSFA